MKGFMKISVLAIALCSLFSVSLKDNGVRHANAADASGEVSEVVGEEKWSLIGSVTDPITNIKDTWTKDFKFHYNPKTKQYELALNLNVDDEFKIRKDKKWESEGGSEFGYSGNTSGGIGDYLTNASGGYHSSNGSNGASNYVNFKVKTAGEYLLAIADNNVASYHDRSYGLSLTPITSATFFSKEFILQYPDGDNIKRSINSLIITTDITNRPSGFVQSGEVGESADVLTDDGYNIGMYLYTNEADNTMYDAVIYANVDRIFCSNDAYFMFSSFSGMKSITFDNFDTSRTTNMEYMFNSCSGLEGVLDVSSFDTSNVNDMNNMFNGCETLTSINLTNFDTSNVTDMGYMFEMCMGLETLDVSSFDTSKVTTFGAMFNGCMTLTKLDLSNFNTSNAEQMYEMFMACINLKEINLSSFDTSKVINMNSMFLICMSLETLDISSFDMSNVSDVDEMLNVDFDNGDSMQQGALTIIKTPKEVGGNPIVLPSKYSENGITTLDSSMNNKTIIAGSAALNELYNALYNLKTCEEYLKAPELQAIYNKLTESDKVTLATLKDYKGDNMNDKYEYIQSYYVYKTPTKQADVHMMMNSADSSSFLVIAIAMSSLAILGYYLIQKRKYAR